MQDDFDAIYGGRQPRYRFDFNAALASHYVQFSVYKLYWIDLTNILLDYSEFISVFRKIWRLGDRGPGYS